MSWKTSLALQENINLGPFEPLQYYIYPAFGLSFSSEFTVAYYMTVLPTKLPELSIK